MTYLNFTGLSRVIANLKNWVISQIPTKTSEITNDSGFITSSSLPTVNNATLTIQKNGTNVQTFTANASSNVTANITVPTKVSELTNDNRYTCCLNPSNAINFDWTGQYPGKIGIIVDNTWLGGILTTDNTTIPTKVSDLSNDSGFLTSHQSLANYVTLDGAQTITGNKTWTGINTFTNIVHAVTNQSVPITENPSAEIIGNNFRFIDNDRFWGQFIPVWGTDGSFRIELGISNWSTVGGQGYWTLGTKISKDFGTLDFYTSHLNANLGTSANQWASVYARAYYYNGTEFQSKFVTVDTNQTITGNKTFTGTTVTHNITPETNATYTLGDSTKWFMDTYTNTVWVQGVRAPGTSNALVLAAMETWDDGARIFMYGKDNANGSTLYADVDHDDGNHGKTGVMLNKYGFYPAGISRHLGLADANYRWLTFNGINPGKLSLPQYGAGRIDISSAITDRAWNVNLYSPPVDGWLAIIVNSGRCIIQQHGTYGPSAGSFDTTDVFDLRVLCPVAAGATYEIFVRGTVNEASLYPCFGNV